MIGPILEITHTRVLAPCCCSKHHKRGSSCAMRSTNTTYYSMNLGLTGYEDYIAEVTHSHFLKKLWHTVFASATKGQLTLDGNCNVSANKFLFASNVCLSNSKLWQLLLCSENLSSNFQSLIFLGHGIL